MTLTVRRRTETDARGFKHIIDAVTVTHVLSPWRCPGCGITWRSIEHHDETGARIVDCAECNRLWRIKA